MLQDFEIITNYLHFAKKPIRFGSVVTKKYKKIVWYVTSPFHPSFDSQQAHTTQWTRNSTVEWFVQIMYKTWMEGTYDKH